MLKVIIPLCVVVIALTISHYRDFLTRLVSIGSGFTAQTVCSGLFVSHLSFHTISSNEIAGLAEALFSAEVDYENKLVKVYIARHLTSRFFAPLAVSRYLGKELGCRLERNSSGVLPSFVPEMQPKQSWVSTSVSDDNGIPVTLYDDLQKFVNYQFSAEALQQNQTRAIVVMHRGKIVAEGYQHALGINVNTPLLGWSMTKSVFATVLAAAVHDGLTTLDSPISSLPYSPEIDHVLGQRAQNKVTFRDLLTMADLLDFEENYNLDKTVPEMLYSSGNCQKFALNRRDGRPEHDVSRKKNTTDFSWYYSSGLSNVLSHELFHLFQDFQKYWNYPFQKLLHKIGATSFTLETDSSGIFVASSFSYATARHWARLGQLYLQRGVWENEKILNEEVIDVIQAPRKYSAGHYGGSFWLNPLSVNASQYEDELPSDHKAKKRALWMIKSDMPADTFYMSGFNGQNTFIIPSLELVIVRLGFTADTPEGHEPKYDPSHIYGTITNLIKARYSH